jgi:hypothetical protein
MRRRVHHLFTYPSTTIFLFREGRTSMSTPALSVDLLAPVWRGITDYPPNERVEEVLGALGKRPLRMTSEAVLEYAGLAREEEMICEALARGPKSLAELKATVRVAPQRIDLLVYLLLVSRSAEPVQGASAAPSSAMWSAITAPQSSRSGEVPKSDMSSVSFARERTPVRGPLDFGAEGIKRRAAEIADEGPFEALGLEDGASLEAARAAFVRLQHIWNPARLPIELEAVRREATCIYEHIVDAHHALTDPRNRAAGS